MNNSNQNIIIPDDSNGIPMPFDGHVARFMENQFDILHEIISEYKHHHAYTHVVKSEMLQLITENKQKVIDASPDRFDNMVSYCGLCLRLRPVMHENIAKLNKIAIKLERHHFAPELNKLWTKHKTFYPVPGTNTIEQAIHFVAKNNVKPVTPQIATL